MSNLPAKHDSTRSSQLPLSNESLRDELLERAGFNKEKKIALIKRIIENAEQDLDATKQTPITERGRVTDVFEQPDYGARAKAREQLIDLIGVTGKRESEGGRGPILPVLPAPWMKATFEMGQAPPQQVVVEKPSATIDVTPQDVVVAAEATHDVTNDPPAE
jgi:hypothetical protein